jgi:signal transduction histidine kinase/ActR/RegA family two-component response regulator
VKRAFQVDWVVSALMLAGIVLLLMTWENTAKNEALVQRSSDILHQSELLVSTLGDAQADARAYVLTGQVYYLKEYRRGINLAASTLSALRGLLSDNDQACRALAEVDRLIVMKEAEIGEFIRLREAGREREALEAVLQDPMRFRMSGLERKLKVIQKAEDTRRMERVQLRLWQRRRNRIVAMSLVVLSWLLFLWSSWRRRRQEAITARMSQERSRHLQELEQMHASEVENAGDLMRLNEELISAKEKMEQAIQSRARFLAQISHDIRTPLSGIAGMSRLLMDEEQDSATRESVAAIYSCATSLTLLLNDVLDLSKVEAGKMELTSAEFDLHELCSEVASLFRAEAAAKRVRLRHTYAMTTPRHLVGDPHRLRQVVTNLLGNAVKFTEEGCVLLSVVAAAVPGKESRLQIRVTDTGVGIRPERMESIFNPYEQAGAGTAERFGGTGLGLSICRHLVELMKGSIHVDSVPGRGSVFTIDLPLIPASVSAIRNAAKSPNVEDVGQVGAGLTVLIADDNRVNQAVCKRLLEKLGAAVDVAVNGREALSACTARRYDLVLMDCMMPEMDGYEATRMLRQIEGGAKMRVIALTADATSEARQRCFEAGMDGFLVKPLRMEALKELLVNGRVLQAA